MTSLTNRIRRLFLLLVCGASLTFATTLQAQQQFAPTVPVQGQLLSRSHGAVPGVTVSLIHPVLGRSAPSFTDVYGRFGWSAIPIRPEAYFLEIYWGQNLIYRQPLQVNSPLRLPPISL